MSLFSLSSHLIFGRPLGRVPITVMLNGLLVMWVSCLRITCPYHDTRFWVRTDLIGVTLAIPLMVSFLIVGLCYFFIFRLLPLEVATADFPYPFGYASCYVTSTSEMSSLTASINVRSGLPCFIFPRSSILGIPLPKHPSSFLHTCPNHVNLASHVFSPNNPTSASFLFCCTISSGTPVRYIIDISRPPLVYRSGRPPFNVSSSSCFPSLPTC